MKITKIFLCTVLSCVLFIPSCKTPKASSYSYEEVKIEINEECPAYFTEELDLGTSLFYANWTLIFDDPRLEVLINLALMKIECSNKKKKAENAFDIEGNLVQDATVVGLTYSSRHIWFFSGEDDEPIMNLCETSFIHELTHAAISTIYGNRGDADHEGGEFKGWTEKHSIFVDVVKAELCLAEM